MRNHWRWRSGSRSSCSPATPALRAAFADTPVRRVCRVVAERSRFSAGVEDAEPRGTCHLVKGDEVAITDAPGERVMATVHSVKKTSGYLLRSTLDCAEGAPER